MSSSSWKADCKNILKNLSLSSQEPDASWAFVLMGRKILEESKEWGECESMKDSNIK